MQSGELPLLALLAKLKNMEEPSLQLAEPLRKLHIPPTPPLVPARAIALSKSQEVPLYHPAEDSLKTRQWLRALGARPFPKDSRGQLLSKQPRVPHRLALDNRHRHMRGKRLVLHLRRAPGLLLDLLPANRVLRETDKPVTQLFRHFPMHSNAGSNCLRIGRASRHIGFVASNRTKRS